MAVDTKQGTSNGAAPNGAAANGAAAAAKRRRSSSLMNAASSLPNVEHSLEEFIAKANQTLVDVSTWGNADQQAKADEDKRKEQDAQRWKQAETQMRESEAREQSLRRQLDGLQGKLAEAEARAAVAGAQVGSAAHDATLSELKKEIEESVERVRAAEEKSQRLSQELLSAKAETDARASGPIESKIDDVEAAERIRLAEAKAAKALAAARAAQAGLTVSPADLAAIESGLVVVEQPAKKSPVVPILLSFVAGTAIRFGVWKFVLDKEPASVPAAGAVEQPVQATPPAAPPATQPTAPPATPPAAAAPVVTPIEEATTVPVNTDGPTVTPIDEPTATEEAAPAVNTKAAASEPKPVKAKPRPRPKAKAKKKAKPADSKPAGGIVDPF